LGLFKNPKDFGNCGKKNLIWDIFLGLGLENLIRLLKKNLGGFKCFWKGRIRREVKREDLDRVLLTRFF